MDGDRPVAAGVIRIRGARQNNLKNLDLDLPTGELIVVTGVSGSGKSSLVFDTLYAEGQRRYVETFSAYARQFLDRMDKPQVDRIEGVPPAIAIDQTNPVRTSRSTVGTMTELNDHLKLLFARAATLHCRQCARVVRRDSAESVLHALIEGSRRHATESDEPRILVTFAVKVPANFSEDEIRAHLQAQGYTRIHAQRGTSDGIVLDVVQDRFRASTTEPARMAEAIEAALHVGQGKIDVHFVREGVPDVVARFSTDLHCAYCDLHYTDPLPSHFSFNSPLGACETCRGFGRVIGVDFGLVIPDERKTLADGAIKPWQSESFKECQRDLMQYAPRRGIALDVPWRDLPDDAKHWVLEGEDDFVSWDASWPGKWYGVRRFFGWLESKAYKMHIRVLLSKYRSYTPCETCCGSRLKPDALLWRVGSKPASDHALGRYRRFKPVGARWSDAQLDALPGLSIYDLMVVPLDRLRDFVEAVVPTQADHAVDEATQVVMNELRSRVKFLCEVGVGYLTLDRQSRTLSGGEVQRINLTTALGTSLVNTLFVLDEPSIGLHPRDMDRIVQVMHRLRDAGNTLVVVEHDPQVMLAADRILDIGPGPGERGGHLVFDGTPVQARDAQTLTGDYLSGRKRVALGGSRGDPGASTTWLELLGAHEHNLKQVDLRIPIGRERGWLVAITGVSGSGKSTLIEDVLYRALLKAFGKPTESSGAYTALRGVESLEDAVMVDQSPIGKTARSNPASYVGAFDAIRNCFARAPEAKRRGYTPGTFSFNSGDGRCPTCGGTGFEHVEMQFLSDVYLRCPDCDGKRFRPETLEITIASTDLRGRFAPASIAQVLDMTVTEALAFFTEEREVVAALRPLSDVGLDYLKLGQPVPTLSGGEAQRLKLAGHLAQAAARKSPRASAQRLAVKPKLFLFDEPTTGLHFDDIATLLRAFKTLLDAGNTLVVIEHNLDVVRASDWVIDLGPEGGDAGGEIIANCTPQDLKSVAASHTGRALAAYEAEMQGERVTSVAAPVASEPRARSEVGKPLQSVMLDRRRDAQSIRIHHAREHNLKNIDVDIPREQFTVITGPSGSGKSTLAFDILFAEGQRRYLESLNAYARSIVQPQGRPDVDAIYGIPPTVAIEQRTSRGGRKSTVATLTEIYHFLRLLYVKLGLQHCPNDDTPVQAQSEASIVARLQSEFRGRRIGLLAPLVVNRKGLYTDLAKWAQGKGYSHLRIDGAFVPTHPFPRLDRFSEHTIDLPVADIHVAPEREGALRDALRTALEVGRGFVKVVSDLDDLASAYASDAQTGAHLALDEVMLSTKRACPTCGASYAELDPRLFSYNSKHGWCTGCYGTGLMLKGFDLDKSTERDRNQSTDEASSWRDAAEDAADALAQQEGFTDEPCAICHGQRLNATALHVRFRDHSIAQLSAMPVELLERFLDGLPLHGREADIARDLLAEIRSRLSFLREVGLDYLALDRSAPTLSGGEAQRIRLAAQLGSNLQGVCYILDEPTIGLHPRDNRMLLDVLKKLQGKGNTLVVVEHDEETIRRADHVIDIGPGAGVRGGEIVGQGTADTLTGEHSLTARFLRSPLMHPLQARRAVEPKAPRLTIKRADLHNLKQVDVDLPLARLTVVTGVSGSGKSTLARDVLHDNARALVANRKAIPVGCAAIDGLEAIDRVLEVDQTPIGKTPRSCPATYVGIWDDIRKWFAESNDARMRGYAPSRFSFNTGAGRCPACEGNGVRTIEMSFLPDVKVQCEVCRGARFNRETLEVKMRDKSIGDVLAMNIDTAVEYFENHVKLRHTLKLLQEVGLGYLTLGQPSPTLSGGEAQRIKLVTELAKVRDDVIRRGQKPPHTLYVLDEPTVGLHMSDVEKLIRVLHRLVEAGNTVVVIEHDLDLIAEADWLIDLGPEGGDRGGRIVAAGPPERVVAKPGASHTARILAEFLATRSRCGSDGR